MLDTILARFASAYVGLNDREEGQALVEYALILALISVVAIALLAGIGGGVVNKLTTVRNAI
jgi:pilus assembly protein Flp/PilA